MQDHHANQPLQNMKVDDAALRLLGGMAVFTRERGGRPLVNLATRAKNLSMTGIDFFDAVVDHLQARHWIEDPHRTPNGDYCARITVSGLTHVEERAARPQEA